VLSTERENTSRKIKDKTLFVVHHIKSNFLIRGNHISDVIAKKSNRIQQNVKKTHAITTQILGNLPAYLEQNPRKPVLMAMHIKGASSEILFHHGQPSPV
jgi:hypothetical protein